jgi:molybdenum cofactor synthesis domain-containing protein
VHSASYNLLFGLYKHYVYQQRGSIVKAALLIIGDEILSGRTQDKNLSYLATWLNEAMIQLVEARIVPDDEAEVVSAVNRLRAKYDYVFTTGGIGPTHDDITAHCVAVAFGVSLEVHAEAYRRLSDYYGAEKFTKARQRMAKTPEGAILIDNPVSVAPGFQMENVFVMAGIPKVMQAMLETVRSRLKAGRRIWSRTLTVNAPESEVAQALGDIQDQFEGVTLGSYPFYREGAVGTEVVIRSADTTALGQAATALVSICRAGNFPHQTLGEIK